MTCKKCEGLIPVNDFIFQEYLALNERIFKVQNNNIKYHFFLNMANHMEEKFGQKLCFCLDNLKEKQKLLEKNIKLMKKLEEQKNKLIQFELNKKINITASKLELKPLYNFLKEQVNYMVYNSRYNPNYVIEYNELKTKIKELNELKETFKLEEYKQAELLIIYGFEDIVQSESYYYDELIKNIIETRYLKELTTYIIYNNVKPTNTFTKIINNINNNTLQNFYSNEDFNHCKIVYKNKSVVII